MELCHQTPSYPAIDMPLPPLFAYGSLLLETPVLDKCDLNHNAVLILELCTGENSSQEIASLMQEAYSLPDPPCQMVEETVANLSRQGFLEST